MTTKPSSVSISFKLPTDVIPRIYFLFKYIIYIWYIMYSESTEICAPYPRKHYSSAVFRQWLGPLWAWMAAHPNQCTVLGPVHALISCCRSFPIRSHDLWNILFHLCIHGFSRAGMIFVLLRGVPSSWNITNCKQTMLEDLWRTYDINSSPISVQSVISGLINLVRKDSTLIKPVFVPNSVFKHWVQKLLSGEFFSFPLWMRLRRGW